MKEKITFTSTMWLPEDDSETEKHLTALLNFHATIYMLFIDSSIKHYQNEFMPDLAECSEKQIKNECISILDYAFREDINDFLKHYDISESLVAQEMTDYVHETKNLLKSKK